VPQEPDDSPGPARRQPDQYRPWTRRQVRTADSWPTGRDQPVSVALSPVGDRLALSVGQRLSVRDITDSSHVTHIPIACALAPGLAWSPGGDKLAFRDDAGWGRGRTWRNEAPPRRTEPRMLPGRVTLTVIGPNREAIWEQVLSRKGTAGSHPEGVNLALSPSGHLLACTTGTSAVWVFETATGRQVRRFDDHAQTVTGISWIDDERVLSASTARRCGYGAWTTRCPPSSWRPSRRRG
jgi:WD40 repeat protein